jgi:hypothetical protein
VQGKRAIQAIVSQNDAGWVIRNSVTFRDFHPALIPRPPTIGGVHACPPIRSDLVIRPNQYVENRADIFRDAEVAGSNPAVPTTQVRSEACSQASGQHPLRFIPHLSRVQILTGLTDWKAAKAASLPRNPREMFGTAVTSGGSTTMGDL